MNRTVIRRFLLGTFKSIHFFLRVRKETAVIMLKMSDATVQNSGARVCVPHCHERCIVELLRPWYLYQRPVRRTTQSVFFA